MSRATTILGGVRLGERREVANIDEHHRHLTTLAGEHVITLLKQLRRESGVDVGAEGGLKSLPLSQTRLHAVERRRQRTEVIILNYRQPLAVVASCNSFSSLGEVAKGSQRRRERGGDRVRYPVAQRHCQPDNSAQHRNLAGRTDHDAQQCACRGEDERSREHAQVRPRGKSRSSTRQGVTDTGVTGEGGPDRSHRGFHEGVHSEQLDGSPGDSAHNSELD